MMKTLSFLIALMLTLSQVAHAQCEKPTSVSQLSEAGALAEAAFADMDAEALQTQADSARSMILPCVADVLTKRDAASFHRIMAMAAFIARDKSRARQELHASLVLEPGYVFPLNVAGPGHPLYTLYVEAETLSDGEGEKIYPPPKGTILVGGVSNAVRYSKTPVIMQVFDAEGTLKETRYVQPGEASPNWSGNAFGITAEDLGIDVDSLGRTSPLAKPLPWFVTAGVGTIVSGVTYGIAMHQKGLYTDPSTPDKDLAGLQTRGNRLATTSLISGGIAVVASGLGIGFRKKPKPETVTTSIPHQKAAHHDTTR